MTEKQNVEIISPESELGQNLHSVWSKNVEAIPKGSSLYNFLTLDSAPLSNGLLCRTKDSNYGILKQDNGNQYLELISDVTSIELRFVEYQQSLKNGFPTFFLGCGMGETLLALQETIKNHEMTFNINIKNVILIESEPSFLHAAFYFFDVSYFLSLFHMLVCRTRSIRRSRREFPVFQNLEE